MKKYIVTAVVKAPVFWEVEAEDREEAIAKANNLEFYIPLDADRHGVSCREIHFDDNGEIDEESIDIEKL